MMNASLRYGGLVCFASLMAACGGEEQLSQSQSAICPAGATCTEEPWATMADGVERVGVNWNYAMGYHFTPLADGYVTALGGHFLGIKKVKLFDRTSGVLLAETWVDASTGFTYEDLLTPVPVQASQSYTVAVYLDGSGGSYRTGITSLPRTTDQIRIDASTYAGTSANPNAVPTISTTTVMFGQADIRFTNQLAGSPAYCAAQADNTNYEYIQGVSVDGVSNVSGGGPGYEDFIAPNGPLLHVTDGASIVLEPGYPSGQYPESWAVWIDQDQDGTFGPSELAFSTSQPVVGTVSGLLSVQTFSGPARMRVRMQYSPGPMLACGSTSYGQVEDYQVEYAGGGSGNTAFGTVTGGTWISSSSSLYSLTVSSMTSTLRVDSTDGVTGQLSGQVSFTDRFVPTSPSITPQTPSEMTVTVTVPSTPVRYLPHLGKWYLDAPTYNYPVSVSQTVVSDNGQSSSSVQDEVTWNFNAGVSGGTFMVRNHFSALRNWNQNYSFQLLVSGF